MQEKNALKEDKMKQEEKYMWAIVDGVKEKVNPISNPWSCLVYSGSEQCPSNSLLCLVISSFCIEIFFSYMVIIFFFFTKDYPETLSSDVMSISS